MEDLVNQVASRTGISHDQAQQAVEIVLDVLKQRVPAPIAGQLDNVARGGSFSTTGAGGLSGALGGLFKRERH